CGIAEGAKCRGSLPSPAPPITWCACEIWRPQFRRCRPGSKCVRWVRNRRERPQERRSFHFTNSIHDEKRRAQHRIRQFFSSLLGGASGYGTVFEVTPQAVGNSPEVVLHS